MKRQHVIIYVPGLGDHNLTVQQNALKLWHIHGITHEICAVKWLEAESWPTKLNRLLERIDYYRSQDAIVSLVGISAGGSAVMAAYGERADVINAVVLVCAKSQYPERIGQRFRDKHPALYDAVSDSSRTITALDDVQKTRVLNMHPLVDWLVPVSETKIAGVRNSRMPVVGHFGGIAYAITIGSFQIVRFVKQQYRHTS